MENNANTSAWFTNARDAGIRIPDTLHQDKKAIYGKLDRLYLPRPETLFFPARDFEKHKDEIEALIKKHKYVFSRLNPHDKDDPRPYRMSISSIGEFMEFVRNSGVDLAKYELHILEEGVAVYGGTVVCGRGVVAELHKGKLDELTHGKVVPMAATFDETRGRFVFEKDKDFTDEEKRLLLRVVSMVKGIRGYFQFTVNGEGKVLFNNYRPDGAFAKI